ncbi:MAG TPA: hypothetical protein VHG93_17530 [Longimicrobium sp.]|nr:hypothetical protein [Longimicrobium sp.]
MPGGIRLSPALFKEIGLTLMEWADSAFLLGVGSTAAKLRKTLLGAVAGGSPLDWTYPFQRLYTGEPRVLRLLDAETGRHIYLPQSLLLGLDGPLDEGAIGVELIEHDFRAPVRNAEGIEYYRQNALQNGRRFFDGENARLTDWDAERRVLVFQGCSYLDYLGTNLSLDAPRDVGKPLREELVYDGTLEPLVESALANSTGVNGLVFTSDGYLIYQKRREDVLLRSGELCSGFSGTIDRIDVEHAVRAGGTLAVMDVPREMVEELGVRRGEVVHRTFLGITRELIRGGAPEMFYALDLSIPVHEVESRIPQDREGHILKLDMGVFGHREVRTRDRDKLPGYFPDLLRRLAVQGGGEVSVPLLTNLVLWLHHNSPASVDAGPLPAEKS